MTLPKLQPASGKWIKKSVLVGLTKSMTTNPNQLMQYTRNDRGTFGYYPKEPTSGSKAILAAHSRICTLKAGADENLTKQLNDSLLGGASYPVLEFALTTAVGFYSSGIGLLLSAGGIGLSLSKTQSRILAR